jgi:hypothetical protein
LVEHTTENRGVPGSSPGLAIRERPWNSGPFVFLTGVVDKVVDAQLSLS